MVPLVTVVEGFAVVPTIGLSLGWVVAIAYVTAHLRGKIMTRASHDEQVTVIKATYQTQVELVEHDRGEWRTESRIKDAQLAEYASRERQWFEKLGGLVVDIMTALKDNAESTRGGPSS